MLATAHLAPGLDVLRVSLHVLAAAVWIGGQIVVAGLLPTVRGFGDDAPKKIARAFARLSWPAFVVLIITGIWNVAALKNGDGSQSWSAVMGIKYVMVILAGGLVYVHTAATSPKLKGASAGIALLASVAAMVLGVALAG